jgi:hypothetical protein
MINGYLLRDILNKVNEIHFNSKDEIHKNCRIQEVAEVNPAILGLTRLRRDLLQAHTILALPGRL